MWSRNLSDGTPDLWFRGRPCSIGCNLTYIRPSLIPLSPTFVQVRFHSRLVPAIGILLEPTHVKIERRLTSLNSVFPRDKRNLYPPRIIVREPLGVLCFDTTSFPRALISRLSCLLSEQGNFRERDSVENSTCVEFELCVTADGDRNVFLWNGKRKSLEGVRDLLARHGWNSASVISSLNTVRFAEGLTLPGKLSLSPRLSWFPMRLNLLRATISVLSIFADCRTIPA